MTFTFDTRFSDSPFVEAIWHTHSAGGGSFMSSADNRWEMVVTRQSGKTTLTMRGPETFASLAPIPEDAEFLGIIFKLGTFMPHLPTHNFTNQGLNLPDASSQKFWLHGSTWQFPDFENTDTFLHRLECEGLLAHDPIVDAVLQNQPLDLSLRTIQRRFLQATGVTQGIFHQIERAKHAAMLLEQGESILNVVELAGYADQPHLTRSLKRFTGKTPAQLALIHEFA